MQIKSESGISEQDLLTIHGWLSTSYWAAGRPLESQRIACENSLNFLAQDNGVLIGFARVVTDRSTFAWICDVFVGEAHRGEGIGKALMKAIDEHPELQGLRRTVLATRDAHGLYKQFGFSLLPHPERWMMRANEYPP